MRRYPLPAKDRVGRLLRDQVPAASPADGYHVLLDLADEQLSLGLSVILDAVFPRDGFRQQARDVATAQGARFAPVACDCSDDTIWRARLATRGPYVPGWPPVGWDEVERLRPLYQPWPSHTALRLDAVDPPDANFVRLLAYLDAAAC